MSARDGAVALVEDEEYDEEAAWAKNHPPAMSLSAILEGFKVARLLTIDIGQIRLIYLLLEVYGRLTVREASKKKIAGKINSHLTADLSEESDEDDDKVISGRLAKGPTSWFEESEKYAGQINILAVYALNLRRRTCQSWVHPKVQANEVVPLQTVLVNVSAHAASLRTQAVPDYTFADMYQEREAQLQTSYFTAKYINKCFTPPDERTSKEKRGYDMLALQRSLVHLHMLPEMSPVFLYNCPTFIENQPDIVRQYQYLRDRNEATAQIFGIACAMADNDELRMKLMELYAEHVGEEFTRKSVADENGSKNGPINWGIEQMVVAGLQTVSRMYGHLQDRPIVFTMSKGVGDYVKDKAPHLLKPNGVSSATKRYQLIKKASVDKWTPLIERKRLDEPEVYESLWKYAQGAVNPSRLNPDQAKLDDITDPLGQALVSFEEFTRGTPYRGSRDPEILAEHKLVKEAAELWKRAKSPMSAEELQQILQLKTAESARALSEKLVLKKKSGSGARPAATAGTTAATGSMTASTVIPSTVRSGSFTFGFATMKRASNLLAKEAPPLKQTVLVKSKESHRVKIAEPREKLLKQQQKRKQVTAKRKRQEDDIALIDLVDNDVKAKRARIAEACVDTKPHSKSPLSSTRKSDLSFIKTSTRPMYVSDSDDNEMDDGRASSSKDRWSQASSGSTYKAKAPARRPESGFKGAQSSRVSLKDGNTFGGFE